MVDRSYIRVITSPVSGGKDNYTYIPIATNRNLGIASFDSNYFDVEDGHVSIKNIWTDLSTTSIDPVPDTIPMRDSQGRVKTTYPGSVNDSANKQYVDEKIAEVNTSIDTKLNNYYKKTQVYNTDEVDSLLFSKLDKVTEVAANERVYIVLPDGTQSIRNVDDNAVGDTIVKRNNNGQVRTASPTGSTDSVNLGYLENNYYNKSSINSMISSVYKAGGSITFAQLIANHIPSATELGYVYDITDAFTTTAAFIEGAGKQYPAGTNVGIIEQSGLYYYDIYSGFVDLSNYFTKTESDNRYYQKSYINSTYYTKSEIDITIAGINSDISDLTPVYETLPAIVTWTTLSSSAFPYTHQATVTATHQIGTDTVIELINNNAVLFATYGFAIGAVSGQNITIYAIDQPNVSVSLEVSFVES